MEDVSVESTPSLKVQNAINRYFEWLYDYTSGVLTTSIPTVIDGTTWTTKHLAPSCGCISAMSNESTTANEPYTIYYNPYYEYGINTIDYSCMSLQVSNDLVTWTLLLNDNNISTYTVPEQYRHYKYFAIKAYGQRAVFKVNAFTVFTPMKNIHLETPPPEGSIITADYDCACVAKDENHVFDFSLTIQLGEAT